MQHLTAPIMPIAVGTCPRPGRSRVPTSERWPTATLLHAAMLVLAAALLASTGCSPTFYRRQADADVYGLVGQKANDPRWPLEGYSINIDPRSRMYDPFDPDCEPMPPDDPTSHQLMHNLDDKKGYRRWHEYGDTPYVEYPSWLQWLDLNDQGQLVLDADAAVEMALLHSPNYQDELEELYLSALDVSFERFRFDAQFFGGNDTFFTHLGRLRSGRQIAGPLSPAGDTNTLATDTGLQMSRRFATAGELLVNFANSFVWQFAGPDTNSVTTIMDFSLIQPLLRRAGRQVELERLTIAERTLLANVRQMERFRRGFYLEVVTGLPRGEGPSRRGGFFGGSGLEGFTGVGGGGFGRVGLFGGLGFGGGIEGAGAGAGLAGGFFGLLQLDQSIRNQQATIASLRNSLAQIEAFFAAGRIDFLQVQQARQALFTAQSQLLITRNTYQTALDEFKRDLGLPPQIEVFVDGSFVERFNLIDSSMVSVQNRLTGVQQAVGQTILAILPEQAEPADQAAPRQVEWTPEMAEALRRLQLQLAEAERIRADVVRVNLPRARQDIQQFDEALPSRRESLENLELELTSQMGRDPELRVAREEDLGIFRIEELQQQPAQLEQTLADLARRLDEARQGLADFDQSMQRLLQEGPMLAPAELTRRLQEQILAPVPTALTELSAQVLELLLVQARARTDSTTLIPVQMDANEAFDIARINRRDWMNARANLVDSWRLIGFNANDLESDLDIVFEGDIGNVGDNPLDLRGATGSLRAGLAFDAPLTRLAERNLYRQALIEYQQARRQYYEFVDRVAAGLRETIRTVELNQINFELRRAAVKVAIAQVELARLRLQEPPRPAVEEALFGPTTANDLVQALSNLLQAQNDFLSVFVDYEVRRRALDYDLGTMQLDASGLWVDPGPIGANQLRRTPQPDDPVEVEPIEPASHHGPLTSDEPFVAHPPIASAAHHPPLLDPISVDKPDPSARTPDTVAGANEPANRPNLARWDAPAPRRLPELDARDQPVHAVHSTAPMPQ